MRLIDADALINTLNEGNIKFNADINYIILNAPTVEAEHVVRCKDCIYSNGMMEYCNIDHWVNKDGTSFCSYGERKK